MSQPTTLSGSFDTSLIDVQQSFSSTDSNTTSSIGKENIPPPKGEPAALDGRDLPDHVDQTAGTHEHKTHTYDMDGNVLLYVDELQTRKMLPEFVRLCNGGDVPRVLDMYCGTGRNLVKLYRADWSAETSVLIYGADTSEEKLDIARRICLEEEENDDLGTSKVRFGSIGISALGFLHKGSFDGIISTLVLSHMHIEKYFDTIASLLKPGGHAIVTNIHPDMANPLPIAAWSAPPDRVWEYSPDEIAYVKYPKATSFLYTPAETVEAAAAAGLELVGEVKERIVEAFMLTGGILADGTAVGRDALLARTANRWVGTKVWYGMVLRKR